MSLERGACAGSCLKAASTLSSLPGRGRSHRLLLYIML